MKAGYLRDMDEAPQTEEAKPTRPSYSVTRLLIFPRKRFWATWQACRIATSRFALITVFASKKALDVAG
jgi:hypothetical protein